MVLLHLIVVRRCRIGDNKNGRVRISPQAFIGSALDAVRVIVNPDAGRGNAVPSTRALLETFGLRSRAQIVETKSVGDEENLARIAVKEGARTIVVVGGDGTCARVANGILASGSTCRLAVFPCGTGNDFAKTLGVSDYTLEQIAALVETGSSTRIDVGLADGHYFLNSCGFGFDASVLEASMNVRFLKGDAVYIYSALAQLLTYRGSDVIVDGAAQTAGGGMLMITVSNGRSLGGAFRIAPHASVLDGELDVCLFQDSNLLERVRLFAAALRGTHGTLPAVQTLTTRNLSLTFKQSPAMEIDGELRHGRSATVSIRCIPRALAVVAAPGALS